MGGERKKEEKKQKFQKNSLRHKNNYKPNLKYNF